MNSIVLWMFKSDKDFQVSAGFTYIHQNEAVDGSKDKMQFIIYTLRD